jgi:hypothetical protein
MASRPSWLFDHFRTDSRAGPALTAASIHALPALLRGLPSFLRCRVDAAAGVVAGPLRGMSAMPRLRIDGAGMQRFDARIILRVLDCDDDLVFPSRRSQTTGFDRGVN